MTDRFETILDDCISAVQSGVPVDEVLEEVPEYASQLRPLLFASAVLTDPDPALVPAEKKAELRSEYMRQVTELPAIAPPTTNEKLQAIARIIKRRLTLKTVLNDLATITITALLTLMMATLLLAVLAIDTLPGDFLYGVKRATEYTRLSLTFDEARQAELANEFNQRRLLEIEELIALDRAAVVQFNGILEAKGENLWVVEGYTVVLPGDLNVEDNPQEGDRVRVIGLLRTNNVLVADTIERLPD